VFVVLKFFSRDREKALPIDQSQSKKSALFINTRATVYKLERRYFCTVAAIEVCNQRAESM
jgi:hypothetical protein